MPGVEAERSSPTDTQIGLLAYFQEATRASWATHQDKHDLEDKALALAVAGVREALQLAVASVKDDQSNLRDLLQAQITALAAVVAANDHEGRLRAEARRETFEKDERLWRAEHQRMHDVLRETQEQRGQEWVASLRQLQDEKERAHLAIHAASQRAIDIADKSMTEKLGEMNNLRTQIATERGTYVNRDMLDSRLATAAEQTTSLGKTNEARLASLERAQNIAWGVVLVLVFVIPIGLRFIP